MSIFIGWLRGDEGVSNHLTRSLYGYRLWAGPREDEMPLWSWGEHHLIMMCDAIDDVAVGDPLAHIVGCSVNPEPIIANACGKPVFRKCGVLLPGSKQISWPK